MEEETFVALIEKQSLFSDDEKKEWIHRIRREGISYELLWDLELALADGIEHFFSRNHLQVTMYPEHMKRLKTERDTTLHALEALRKEVLSITRDTTQACDTIATDALTRMIKKKASS